MSTAPHTPRTEIIVVSFNQPHYEAFTVGCVAKNTKHPYDLTVHRNLPGVSLAKCWNMLIERSTADYICLLNPDTAVAKGWLGLMVDSLEAGCCAVVPSSNAVFLSQIDTPFPKEVSNIETINNFASGLEYGAECLRTASAMCVLFRREDWLAAGRFDEEFMLYGEDTEFFWRLVKKTGRTVTWRKDAYVHHYKARCTSKAAAEGLDLAAIRRESERMVNEKTDLDIRHV